MNINYHPHYMSAMNEHREKMSAVVTGCTSGLGRSLFNKFSAEGWSVTGCGRRIQLLESLKEDKNADASTVPCDIRLENHVLNLRSVIRAKPGYIDALVLNAGTIGQLPLPAFDQINLMELRRLFESNVFANFNVVQKLLPLMNAKGIIVHITSDASRTPYAGWSGYGASKAAFNQAINVLDVELAKAGVRAMNIDPGDMDTEMHRLAIPDADVSQLKHPDTAATDVYKLICEQLTAR